jgi:hypothetical protein
MNVLIKYLILIPVFSLGLNETFAQLDTCLLITSEKFQGTLFQENFLIDISPDNSGRLKWKPIEYVSGENIKKWTPTKLQIIEFESNLYDNLKKYKPKDEYDENGIIYILKELANYKRYYIGYLDSLDNQCLWIKFYNSDNVLIEPEKRIKLVLGGGADYFTLWFDLTENKIVGISINGLI